MSTFIDLLRIHHGEFERQFGNQCLTIVDVQSTPCSVVKRATKVAHNGIVVTANMMTDCRFLAAIDIVRNASNARLLVGLSASNQSYCPCTTLWSRSLCPMNSGC